MPILMDIYFIKCSCLNCSGSNFINTFYSSAFVILCFFFCYLFWVYCVFFFSEVLGNEWWKVVGLSIYFYFNNKCFLKANTIVTYNTMKNVFFFLISMKILFINFLNDIYLFLTLKSRYHHKIHWTNWIWNDFTLFHIN